MVSRLPAWVEYGAFILALVAGYVNAVGLLGFEHQSVSHVSGTASLLGSGLARSPLDSLLHYAGILLAFLLGASVTGWLVPGTALKLGRHYDTALLLEAVLIFLSQYLLMQGSFLGHFTASAACGLQNALATTYSGAIVRTTHLTGIFTDLGIMLGAVFRGEQFDRRKAVLFLLIIAGFVSGGALGAFGFARYSFNALILPGLVCLVLAGTYRKYALSSVRITRR